MRSRSLYDVAAVLARLGAGVIFIAHGWQKIEAGVTATGEQFDALGVPLATAAAVYATFVELLGGTALIAGLGMPITGALLFVNMAGALVFVHADQGLFMVDGGEARNGWELVVALGMISLLFAAGGGGRLTADQWLIHKRGRHTRGDRPEDDEEGDMEDFVESLRDIERRPAGESARPAPATEAPAPAPSSPAPPAKPPKPAEPAPAEAPDATASDTDDDNKPVAGRRKPTQRRRTSGTKAAKPPADDDGGTST